MVTFIFLNLELLSFNDSRYFLFPFRFKFSFWDFDEVITNIVCPENIDTEKNFYSLFNAINKMADKYDMPVSKIHELYKQEMIKRKKMDFDDQMVYAYTILRKFPDILHEQLSASQMSLRLQADLRDLRYQRL